MKKGKETINEEVVEIMPVTEKITDSIQLVDNTEEVADNTEEVADNTEEVADNTEEVADTENIPETTNKGLSIFKGAPTVVVSNAAKQLDITNQLTNIATIKAEEVLAYLKQNENGDALVALTIEKYAELSSLLKNLDVIQPEEWLKGTNEDVVTRALKSQQSKRSRAHSALLAGNITIQDYKKYLIGAIAEGILRVSCNIASGNTGNRGSKAAASFELTEEDRLRYSVDQMALAKAIRNVQSKKTAIKKLEGFTEEDPTWMKAIAYEEQLKQLRTNTPVTVDTEVLNKAKQADEIAAAISALGDVSKMKKADLEKAFADLKELSLSKIE